MGKVIRPFCWHQNFVPCPGTIYTCIKSWKQLYKIRLQISLKLATSGKSDKAFLLTPKFRPLGSLWPCAGATCIKSWKKLYKIRLQRHFCFKLATNKWSDKTYLLTSKLWCHNATKESTCNLWTWASESQRAKVAAFNQQKTVYFNDVSSLKAVELKKTLQIPWNWWDLSEKD